MISREIKILSFVITFLLLVESALANSAEKLSTVTKKSSTVTTSLKSARTLDLTTMSSEEKVGQLFIFGFSGTSVSVSLAELMKDLRPGALIVFKRNIRSLKQVGELNFRIQSLAKSEKMPPLFIMVDQEGGNVTRLQTSPPPPSALALGETRDPNLAKEVGVYTGRLLSSLGFNMNLAPVFDLSDPSEMTFVGNRSFGEDPKLVFDIGHAYSLGLLESGVLPTAKHFPGHGGILADSHKTLPSKKISLETLMQHDLYPFIRLTKQPHPSALMVAHVAYPLIDASGFPATFSRQIVEDILQERLNYQGIIITDDIEMDGADVISSIGERAVHAFEAGCDMIMVAWSPRRQKLAYEALLKAVQSGRISQARLDRSVAKILKLKSELGLVERNETNLSRFDPTKILEPIEGLKEASRHVLERHFERFQSESFKVSSVASNASIAVLSGDYSFYDNFRKTGWPKARLTRISKQTSARLGATLSKAKDDFFIFYVSGVGSAKLLDLIPARIKRKMIVVNTTTPGNINNPQNFLGVVNIFTHNPQAGTLLGELLREPKPVADSNHSDP